MGQQGSVGVRVRLDLKVAEPCDIVKRRLGLWGTVLCVGMRVREMCEGAVLC